MPRAWDNLEEFLRGMSLKSYFCLTANISQIGAQVQTPSKLNFGGNVAALISPKRLIRHSYIPALTANPFSVRHPIDLTLPITHRQPTSPRRRRRGIRGVSEIFEGGLARLPT